MAAVLVLRFFKVHKSAAMITFHTPSPPFNAILMNCRKNSLRQINLKE